MVCWFSLIRVFYYKIAVGSFGSFWASTVLFFRSNLRNRIEFSKSTFPQIELSFLNESLRSSGFF